VAAVNELLELVLLHDAGRKDFDGDSRVIRLIHGSLRVESLVSIVINFALEVDRTRLKRRLTVVMSAVGAVTSPGCWIEVATMRR
jgi:hypothetical protein